MKKEKDFKEQLEAAKYLSEVFERDAKRAKEKAEIAHARLIHYYLYNK